MVSVVVPVYNVQDYLERCVDSIINQTFSDLEILLVDDGATDKSPSMCNDFAKADGRIKVIHKENGGLSSARNSGIEAATGDYICFIDSDDYIEADMIELLTSTIGDCDICTCGVYNNYASGVSPQYAGSDQSFETDGEKAFAMILHGKLIPATICNKLIKMSIAKGLRFPVGKLYEDAFFTNDLMPLVTKVNVNTSPKYHYVHRAGSITTTPFKPKDMDVIAAYEKTQELIDRFPTIIEFAKFRLQWAHFTVLDRILMVPNYKTVPEYEQVVGYLKVNAFKIMSSPVFTKNRKIAAFALKINVGLYRILLMRNEKHAKRLHG